VVEVINGFDLTAMSKSYRGAGSTSYHPAALPGLLIHGYATGVFSGRELERARHDSVAFRFIAANDCPDHDTIATFRRRLLSEIESLFVKVLLLAREMGVLKMGTVALDGTKIHVNASRYSALSYEHAGKIEARARERFARELAEHEAKRAAKTAVTGKKPGGKPPPPPVEGRLPTDQVNLTDEDSRIMPVAGGGFEQGDNAQAVAADSLLAIAANVVQAPNDKQQIEPILNDLDTLPDELGKADMLLADIGYFSAANVGACEAVGIDPLITPRLRKGKHGQTATSPAVERTVRRRSVAAGQTNAGGSHDTSAENAGRPGHPCFAQANPGTGLRHHQIGDGLPAIPSARDRQASGRMEARDHGLERQADVHPLSSGMRREASFSRPTRRATGCA
jgi:transposase